MAVVLQVQHGLVVGDTMQNVVGMLLLMSTQNPVHIFVDVFRSLDLEDSEFE